MTDQDAVPPPSPHRPGPPTPSGHVLVVDDDALNRRLLERALAAEGYAATLAADGADALERLQGGAADVDVVLLDVLMPRLDGYGTLAAIKADPDLRHLPVIMITAVDETASALRCIELGAADYLPKPADRPLLRARLAASLAGKRLRDLELEYLEQVARVTRAAEAVEAGGFTPADLDPALDPVAARPDALGSLARVFQRMAGEVAAREARLRRQVRELQIEIDAERQAAKVAEITESDYYRRLRAQADDLRRILD